MVGTLSRLSRLQFAISMWCNTFYDGEGRLVLGLSFPTLPPCANVSEFEALTRVLNPEDRNVRSRPNPGVLGSRLKVSSSGKILPRSLQCMDASRLASLG